MERFLTPEEQNRLLAAARNSSWDKMYLLLLIALTTGARKGEISNLHWSDIDFKTRRATLHMTKNGKPRILPLTQNVIEELMKFREIGETLVFKSNQTGKPFDFRKPFNRALKQAEIDNCRFHDLRHTCASNLARNGYNLLQIGDLLGHSSVTTTQRYAHLCVESKQNMVDDVMGKMGII